MARRSANECASILDIYGLRNAVGDASISSARELLARIAAMLTRMIQSAGISIELHDRAWIDAGHREARCW
jgi:hypothetical protein